METSQYAEMSRIAGTRDVVSDVTAPRGISRVEGLGSGWLALQAISPTQIMQKDGRGDDSEQGGFGLKYAGLLEKSPGQSTYPHRS